MKKVFIVIERRADYSRFRPIMLRMKSDPYFKLHIVVTGLCLLPKHGKDIKYIEEDGFEIQKKIKMFKNNAPDTGAEMMRAVSRFMGSVVDELEKTKPDIILSGFDIGANFAVTMAGAHMNIPVAHIQGGELSGSIDESLRHAMSKFAHIHFVSTNNAKNRLIRMGENPENVYVVGCPSIDTLISCKQIQTKELEKYFKINFTKPVALLIQHPVTTEYKNNKKNFLETIAALKKSKIQVIALLPNNDAGFSALITEINKTNFTVIPSLSMTMYANLLKNINVLIGNSSSGIHEAATYFKPVINIGNRQIGREHGINVIDVNYDRNEIFNALNKCLYNKNYLKRIKSSKNIYGDGIASEKIVSTLKELKLTPELILKKFYE